MKPKAPEHTVPVGFSADGSLAALDLPASKKIRPLTIGLAVPLVALSFFIGIAFVQGDIGFQVDKTQHGLLVTRIVTPVNPVHKGDYIVALQAIAYPQALGYLFSPAPREKELSITIERNGTAFKIRLHSVPLTLTRLTVLAGPRFALITFFLLLASVARFRAPESIPARLFFLMVCGLSTSVVATLPSCITVLYPPVLSLSFLLLTVSNWFGFGTLLHFAFRFPPGHDLLVKKKWPLFLIYLLPPAVSLSASLFAGGISPAFWGWLQRLRNAFLPAIIIAVFAKMRWDYRHMQTAREKKRFRPIVLSYWISFGPYLCLYLLPNLVADQPFISFRAVVLFFLVLPLAYLYVLLRYHLFDVDQLLSRLISYGILTGLVLLFYALFLVTVKRWLFGKNILSEELFLAFFTISVLLFWPIQKRMERLVGRLFLRYRPVPAELLHQFSNKIVGLLSVPEIIEAMVCELPTKINVHTVAVLLLDQKHSRLYPENLRFGSSPWPQSELVSRFGHLRQIYIRTDQNTGNPRLERELHEIRKEGFSLVLPMRTASGLSALLLIGFRQDGRRFSWEDIQLMCTLANQGAVALENAKRHESLLESKKQIEKLFNTRIQHEKMVLIGEMTSMVAHEFKNPLGIIHSSAQYLLSGHRSPDVRKEMLGYIVDEVENLNFSIESLLRLAGQRPPKFSRVDLSRELPRLIDQWLRSSNHNPLIDVNCEADPHLRPLYLDLRQFRQVLFNLIRNSEEMMPRGGWVLVTAESRGEHMTIRVVDNGPGIEEENMDHLFKSFFTTKDGGIGLGLVVCHQIISAHRGTITLGNNPEGGTTVWIQLPLEPLPLSGLSKEEQKPRHGEGEFP